MYILFWCAFQFVGVTSLLHNVTVFVSAHAKTTTFSSFTHCYHLKINKLYTLSVVTVRPIDAGNEATGSVYVVHIRRRGKCATVYFV